jgi:hypothetical protein
LQLPLRPFRQKDTLKKLLPQATAHNVSVYPTTIILALPTALNFSFQVRSGNPKEVGTYTAILCHCPANSTYGAFTPDPER